MDLLKDLTIDNLRNAAEDAFNQAKPKSEVEARVYEVLSHKNWGSSSTIMNEIAHDTYDYDKFPMITKLMWESMENQRPAAWRVVFKGMTLLEHMIKNGSERCVDDARNHTHLLRKLQQFNYYEGTIDRGLGVREKSKQILEILGDDERIREERQKARKLREKFGGNLGGVGSGGGGGQYAGYGNDSAGGFGGRSSSSGGGGYGDSAIGRSASGGGGGYGGDTGGNFSGRYSDESAMCSTSSSATPTFATIPDDVPKKKLKKKKKKKPIEEEQAPAAPEIDLFSFDAPSPAAPAPAAVEFGAFDSAPAAPVAANGGDDFGDFASFKAAPVQAQPLAQQNVQFDAFQSAPAMSTMNPGNHMAQVNDMFGQMQVGVVSNGMNNGGGMMGGTLQPQQQFSHNDTFGSTPSAGGDDDFGDFEAAAPKLTLAPTPTASSDPLSRLISLDSLTKNTQKKESKVGQPLNPNQAAAQFVQNSQSYVTPNQGMAFGGNNSNGYGMPMNGGGWQAQNQAVLGTATAGGADVISMMGPPQQMMGQHPQSGQGMPGGMHTGIQQQTGMGMANTQMMSQGGMSQQGGMQQQGMGMMNPQMMQQGSMQGGMGMQQGGMQGGMGMQQGGMGMQQGGMGMQQGGMPMGGNMMGGQMPGGQMGGQPMQGWR